VAPAPHVHRSTKVTKVVYKADFYRRKRRQGYPQDVLFEGGLTLDSIYIITFYFIIIASGRPTPSTVGKRNKKKPKKPHTRRVGCVLTLFTSRDLLPFVCFPHDVHHRVEPAFLPHLGVAIQVDPFESKS
jgi:hypothetical protein